MFELELILKIVVGALALLTWLALIMALTEIIETAPMVRDYIRAQTRKDSSNLPNPSTSRKEQGQPGQSRSWSDTLVGLVVGFVIAWFLFQVLLRP